MLIEYILNARIFKDIILFKMPGYLRTLSYLSITMSLCCPCFPYKKTEIYGIQLKVFLAIQIEVMQSVLEIKSILLTFILAIMFFFQNHFFNGMRGLLFMQRQNHKDKSL